MPEMTRDEIYTMVQDLVSPAVAELVKKSKAEAEESAAKAKETEAKALAANRPAPDFTQPNTTKQKDAKDIDGTLKAAQCFRAHCLATRSHGVSPVDIAKQLGMHEDVVKALGEATLAGGGAIIPPAFMPEIIAALKARSVVRRLGATSIDMPTGAMAIPYVNSGATAAYTGESTGVNATAMTTGQLQLLWKKLEAIVPVSNDMLKHAGSGPTSADAMIRDDLVRSLAAAEDSAFIRGSGTASKPRGMYYQAASANINARTKAGALSTLAEKTADICAMIGLVETANIDVATEKCGIVMAPRTKWNLMAMRDGNGNFAFREEMLAGRLFGFEFGSTSNVPINLTTVGSVGSELYFAAFSLLVIGEDTQIELQSFDGAAYLDSTGTLVSGVSRDETVIRAIARHDFGARMRGAEIGVITTLDADW